MKQVDFTWQRRLVLLSSLAVMCASFKHLAGAFLALEPGGSGGTLLSWRAFPAMLAAGAVDLSVLTLTRLALSGKEHGGKVGVIIWSVTVVTLISMIGNFDTGVQATVAHDAGGSGILWTLADLRQLDWLVVARVFVFLGMLPALQILLSLSGTRAAEIAHASQEPVITLEAPQAPAKAPVRREPQRMRQITGGSVAQALLPSGEVEEDPDRISMRGSTTRAERIAIARRVMQGGGGVGEIMQEADVSIRTAFRLRNYIRDEARSVEASGDGRML